MDRNNSNRVRERSLKDKVIAAFMRFFHDSVSLYWNVFTLILLYL